MYIHLKKGKKVVLDKEFENDLKILVLMENSIINKPVIINYVTCSEIMSASGFVPEVFLTPVPCWSNFTVKVFSPPGLPLHPQQSGARVYSLQQRCWPHLCPAAWQRLPACSKSGPRQCVLSAGWGTHQQQGNESHCSFLATGPSATLCMIKGRICMFHCAVMSVQMPPPPGRVVQLSVILSK